MQIYRLTKLGYTLSHSHNNPQTPEWAVIHFLAKNHTASAEKLMAEVPGVTSITISKLRMKKIIADESGVEL